MRQNNSGRVRAISLFSGAVDGMGIALERQGIPVTHKVEIDPWCCKVLRKNFPYAVVINKDIRRVKAQNLGNGTIDIMAGSPPCQPFSVAGERKLTEDERHLWPTMFRLVRKLRPQVVVVENVRGSTSGEYTLADEIRFHMESEGYQVGVFLYPAALFSAPHERYRAFYVCELADANWQRQRRAKYARKRKGSCHIKRNLATTQRGRFHQLSKTGRGRKTLVQAKRTGLAHPITAQQPKDKKKAGTRLEYRPQRSGRAVVNAFSPRPQKQHAAAFPGEARHTSRRHHPKRSRRQNQSRMGRTPDGPSARMDFPGWPAGQGHFQYHYEPARTKTDREDDDKKRIAALGNAIVWQQFEPIAKAIKEYFDAL